MNSLVRLGCFVLMAAMLGGCCHCPKPQKSLEDIKYFCAAGDMRKVDEFEPVCINPIIPMYKK